MYNAPLGGDEPPLRILGKEITLMWNRKELKKRGKAAFKANYWRCVLVALIIVLIAGAAGGASGRGAAENMPYTDPSENVTQEYLGGAITLEASGSGARELIDSFNALLDDIRAEGGEEAVRFAIRFAAGLIGGILAVGFLVNLLLINPLRVGCNRFFAENSYSPAGLGEIGYAFRSGYSRVVGTMLRQDIYLILWSLLFIIPGIVKSYSYRMVPYILAEGPELSGREVIDRSRRMMNGNKWKAFVLDLSWILWILLTVITLGLAGVFYVNPYIEATNAELYHALK